MGQITKSLWELFTTATAGAPADTDLIGVAPQPGTPFTTQLKAVTVAQLNAGAVAAGNILHTRVVATNAEVIALRQTPKTVVAAVAGKIIVPLRCVLQLEWVANYSGIDAGCFIFFGVGAVGISSSYLYNLSEADSDVTNLLAPGATLLTIVGDYDNSAGLVSSGMPVNTGLPLQLCASSQVLDFGGGNVGNSLAIDTYYSLVDPS